MVWAIGRGAFAGVVGHDWLAGEGLRVLAPRDTLDRVGPEDTYPDAGTAAEIKYVLGIQMTLRIHGLIAADPWGTLCIRGECDGRFTKPSLIAGGLAFLVWGDRIDGAVQFNVGSGSGERWRLGRGTLGFGEVEAGILGYWDNGILSAFNSKSLPQRGSPQLSIGT